MNQQEFLAGSPRCDSIKKLYDYVTWSGSILYSDRVHSDRDWVLSNRYGREGNVVYRPRSIRLDHHMGSELEYPLLATAQDAVHFWFAREQHRTGTPIAWLWPKLREHTRRVEGASTYEVRTWALLSLTGWGELDKKHWFHLSQTDPEALAYFQTDDKLRRDISTKISVGRFVKKFWPHLLDHDVRDIVNAHRNEVGKRNVKFSTDPSEIVRIYEHGPRSCMRGMDCVRIYGDSPDLAVAYLGDLEAREISARAVVWPAEKRYVRIYGDDLLRVSLERMGYRNGDLEGARVRRIEEHGRIVMPYLDGPQYVDEGVDWLILTEDGDIDCSNTSGYASGGRERCSCCGSRVGDDEIYTADDGERVCTDCIGSRRYGHTTCSYVWATVDANWHHDTEVCRRDNCWWSEYHDMWVSEDLSYSDFGLVELEDGSVVEEDDAVETIDGHWRLANDCIEIHADAYQPRDDLDIDEWYVHEGELKHATEFGSKAQGESLLDAWAKLLLAANKLTDEEAVLSNNVSYFSDELVREMWEGYGDDVLARLEELKTEELPLDYQPADGLALAA